MKRILVPIDFSAYAESALLSAVKIAAKGDVSITCVNVVNSPLDWKNFSEQDKQKHREIMELEAEAKDKLDAFVMEHAISTNPVETLVEVGFPADRILHAARQQQADLIVLGAYGKGHQPEKFLGSNLQKIIRMASCPVMAVKTVIDSSAIRKVAFASLFQDENKPAFQRLKPLVNLLNASVHFLYVNTPTNPDPEKAMATMDAFLRGEHDTIVHKNIYNAPEPEKGIIQFCEMNKVGLIAISSSNRKAAKSYQVGVTDTVLFHSNIPVLSINMGD